MYPQYRPTSFEEIVGQPTDTIEQLLDGFDTPNFLFYGPPGTGKTTTAYCIAAALQGTRHEIMVFNASDDRGIDTVRESIIPVVNQYTLRGTPRVIFLDEMDSMTMDAQQALRQPMEDANAVFILACNDSTLVHGAVRSRCRAFEFGPVSEAAVRERIEQLAAQDDVDLTNGHVKACVNAANGDMRGAIQRYVEILKGAFDVEPSMTWDGESLERQARQFAKQDHA